MNSNWLNSFKIPVACSVLPFISQGIQSDEWTWKSMSLPSQYLNTCKQFVRVIVVYMFCICCACNVVIACLLVYLFIFYTDLLLPLYFFTPVFVLMLLLYFCLSINHVSKCNVFIFGAFHNVLRIPHSLASTLDSTSSL